MDGPVALDLDGFHPRAVDKVRRLLTVLDAINADRTLAPRVCLHGGTALNLFVLGAPRLSVDIDLNYVAATDVAQMRAERPGLEQALLDVAEGLGLAAVPGKSEHSGRSKLRFQGVSALPGQRSSVLAATCRAVGTARHTVARLPNVR
ncbi:MAG: nucleotidyl transferase AbiEii/AbiGii toxin family protein [Micrococcales bacterium]|nr:nucleotidyl transferase AbiEii/AbiGii toxin family protein [Micrococcales bacterium]